MNRLKTCSTFFSDDRSQGNELDFAIGGRWVAEETLVGFAVELREVVGVLVFDLEWGVLAAEAEFGDAGGVGIGRIGPIGLIQKGGERNAVFFFLQALWDGLLKADGAEDAGMLRHEDRADAEALRDGTGMLRASASKSQQRVIGGIVAFADADAADGIGHVLDGKAQQGVEEFFFALSAVVKLAKALSRGIHIERNGRF